MATRPGDDLAARVEGWTASDPDPTTAEALRSLAHASAGGDAEATAELHRAFASPLEFGTAGIRGPVGPGPARMNAAVAARLGVAVANRLAPGAVVVVGRDGRASSVALADAVVDALVRAGAAVSTFDEPVPTPVLAFAVRHIGAAAGLMVTASHNPAHHNGIKVFAADGAQIVAPADTEIAAAMAVDRLDGGGPALDPPDVDRPASSPASSPSADGPSADGPSANGSSAGEAPAPARLRGSVGPVDAAVVDAYVERAAANARWVDAGSADARPAGAAVTIAYGATHGVGGAVTAAVMARLPWLTWSPDPRSSAPDPQLGGLASPNPERAEAWTTLLDHASAVGAVAAFAHDPDADRLGVAVPDPHTGWRRLTGDEIGALLAHHLLRRPPPDDRPGLVVGTVVSSRLVPAIAAAAGATYVDTLSGFKWIVRAAAAHPNHRWVLGYEQALGFRVDEAVHDKDGISAAVVIAELVADLAEAGRSLADRLDELAQRHGLHLTRSAHVSPPSAADGEPADGEPAEPAEPGERMATAMDALRRRRGTAADLLAGATVTDHGDPAVAAARGLPRTDLVVATWPDGTRLAVRPSGTEAELKVYVEVVGPVEERSAIENRADATVRRAVEALQGCWGTFPAAH